MKYLFLFIFITLTTPVFAQSKLPVIKATSKKVAINDGGVLDKNAWSLSPQARPDVFTADRTRQAKWVTFYTDIDSIRVRVKPGTRFNFVILLNGKDSCYTQIASAIPPEDKLKNNIISRDTIPFTLTAHNAIHIKAVINDADTLNLHFDLSSFDFHFTRDAILKRTRLLPNQADVLAGKAKPDYNNLNKAIKLQMGSMIWRNREILPTNITAIDMDGRFGWNLFEGKQVEVNYDKKVIVIHTKLPEVKSYVKSKIGFTHSFGYVSGSFEMAGKSYTGNFMMDTGSESAAILDSGWVAQQNFPGNLKVIKTSTISDPRGIKYEMKIVEVPLFRINSLAQANVPTVILSRKNPAGFDINFLGNGLLKHFNMILDFKKDYLYLKPNKIPA